MRFLIKFMSPPQLIPSTHHYEIHKMQFSFVHRFVFLDIAIHIVLK